MYIIFICFGVGVMALMMSEHVQEAIMEMVRHYFSRSSIYIVVIDMNNEVSIYSFTLVISPCQVFFFFFFFFILMALHGIFCELKVTSLNVTYPKAQPCLPGLQGHKPLAYIRT